MRARIFIVAATLVVLFLVLSIPGSDPAVPISTRISGFRWNQDGYWDSLEGSYQNLRQTGCSEGGVVAAELAGLDTAVAGLLVDSITADAPLLGSVEHRFFDLGPYAAACPQFAPEYFLLSGRIREAVKRQSRHWDVGNDEVRERLYRSLYGSRGVIEEVMLHHPDSVPSLLPGTNEPSVTPSAMVQGVEIHSGDMLVSRGGYPTSALIARGNDFPGNFSHVALVYVDSATHAASTIEAHIERGVAISSADEYLADKKLRILVLRPRADLPQLRADPMLPHRAASMMLDRARREHIPYDFTMDYSDPSHLFCSEVASAAYRDAGVTLWMGMSTISSPGLRRWLGSFGVRHFETQEPSDLEYDPQLVVVAEWRNPATLRQDHIDNAVIDAMLEGAEQGDRLTYPWYQLAPARLAKAYSWILGRFGRIGPIPEGMSTAAALRNSAFSKRQGLLAARVSAAGDSVTRVQGYPPPYWRLLTLARRAIEGERAR
ncbi:MAG: YiiX/YebB-like N1pC/P60 family cysteine hydrolase [Gemmatimonadota bacterium]